MNHIEQIRALPLPPITIPASDYDRLDKLASTATAPLAAYLRRELVRAAIVADADFDSRVARIGSRITYREEPAGHIRTVTLVWPSEVSMERGRIAVTTAIGAALLGMRPRHSIDWPAPQGGLRRLTVLVVNNGDESGPAAA